MPVPLRLTTITQPLDETVWIGPGETVSWKVVSTTLPKQVEVDPDGWILMRPHWDERANENVIKPRRDD